VTGGTGFERPTTTATEAGTYRPHLDGLRAVAVYLVVAYHAGADRFDAGFVGVDVFFVLSGYLVTQVLLRDLGRNGRIRFANFYARRFRRLLPASFAALIITAVVYSALASPVQVDAAENAFKAAFLYVANWFFIHRAADYFATNINANPVIHYWSLAVEEQFYLLWPLLLGGLVVVMRPFARHRTRAIQIAVGVCALASLVWALHLQGINLTRAYYGTDTRAYELLAGALLALTPGVVRRATGRRGMSALAVAGIIAVVLIGTSLLDLQPVSRGIAVTIATLVLLVAIESAPARSPVNRLLSCGPMTYLGRISYGTYLWHWPVIVFALLLTDNAISPMSAFAISAVLGTALASLSYTLLEMPIRRPPGLNRVPRIVIAVGLTVAVVSAVVLIPAIDTKPPPQSTAAANSAKTGSGSTASLDLTTAKKMPNDLQSVPWLDDWNCSGRPASACTIIKGSGAHVLIIGDSTAWAMFPAFAKIARAEHLQLSTAAATVCPWQRHLFYSDVSQPYLQVRRKACEDYKRDLYDRVIPALKPDLVVAISIDYADPLQKGAVIPGVIFDDQNRTVATPADKEYLADLKADTERSVAAIARSAGKVLLVDPAPRAPYFQDPFSCLSKNTTVAPCRFLVDPARKTTDRIYHDLADGRRVYNADFEKLYCPFAPICDPVIDGRVVWFDQQHVTAPYAESLAVPITLYLKANRLIG
jgi:peptidoglycan/LPS O-acetylase OafA/YrhL